MKRLLFLLLTSLLASAPARPASFARVAYLLPGQAEENAEQNSPTAEARADSTSTRPEVTWETTPEPHAVTNQVSLASASVSTNHIQLAGRIVQGAEGTSRMVLEGRISGEHRFTGNTSNLYVKYRVHVARRLIDSAISGGSQTVEVSENSSTPLGNPPEEVLRLTQNGAEHSLQPTCNAAQDGCDWDNPANFQEILTGPGGDRTYECIAGNYLFGFSSSGQFFVSPCYQSSMESFWQAEEDPSGGVSVKFSTTMEETQELETAWILVDPAVVNTFAFTALRQLSMENHASRTGYLDRRADYRLTMVLGTKGTLTPREQGGDWQIAPPAGIPVEFELFTNPGLPVEFPPRKFEQSFVALGGTNGTTRSISIDSEYLFYANPFERHSFSRNCEDSLTRPDAAPISMSTFSGRYSQFPDPTLEHDSLEFLDPAEVPAELAFTVASPLALAKDWYDLSTSWSGVAPLRPQEWWSLGFILTERSTLHLLAESTGGRLSLSLLEDTFPALSSNAQERIETRMELFPGYYQLDVMAEATSPSTTGTNSFYLAINPPHLAGIMPSASGVSLDLARLPRGRAFVVESLAPGATGCVEVARFVPTAPNHRVWCPAPPDDQPQIFRLRQLRDKPGR